MKNETIEIDVGYNLEDSHLLFYNYDKNSDELTVKLETWNSKIINFIFKNPILFIDRGCDTTTKFCENNSKSNLLIETLKRNYDGGKIPKNQPYKQYQLLDLDDNPSLDIICKNMMVQNGDHEGDQS